MSRALIIYPDSSLTIPLNLNDRVEVSYNTTWANANLSMACRPATGEGYIQYDMPDNPLPKRGTYLTPVIQSMKFAIHQWPTDCVFRLTKWSDATFQGDGSRLALTSIDSPARTFMISKTIGLVMNTTSTAATASAATSGATTTSAAESSSQAPHETDSASSYPSHGLSKVASAGIGAGVTVGVLIVIASVAAFISSSVVGSTDSLHYQLYPEPRCKPSVLSKSTERQAYKINPRQKYMASRESKSMEPANLSLSRN